MPIVAVYLHKVADIKVSATRTVFMDIAIERKLWTLLFIRLGECPIGGILKGDT
jgi:hypothetical protein